jgi:hypothetical protein
MIRLFGGGPATRCVVTVVGSLLLLTANTVVSAQESFLEDILPGMKDRALILKIVARVLDEQGEVWNSNNAKVTIPGRPVGVKLVGENLIVLVQFTPYFRRDGEGLIIVAQGQIWVDIPNVGIHYQTTVQSIALEFGEPVYFFPLGAVVSPAEASIEIKLELNPYTESGGTEADEQNYY